MFRSLPCSAAVRGLLGRVVRKVGIAPKYVITDQGQQLVGVGFRRWCRRRGIRWCFGAVGK